MSALWWFGLIATPLVLLLLRPELCRAWTRVGQTSRPVPGFTTLLSPLSPFNGLFPRLPFVSLGANWSWRLNYQLFQQVGCDILAVRSLLPTRSVILLIADNDVATEIVRQRVKFPKPAAFLQIFNIFGTSIVNTEGEEWRHHRRIVGPAFNEDMNAAVWRATSDVMVELFGKWETDMSSPSIPVESFVDTAMEMALLVLCRAGFSQFVGWNSHCQIPAGHNRSFREAVEIVTTNVPLYTFLPTWLLNCFHRGRVVVEGFAEMRQYILETAENRRVSSSQQKPNDLLSNLVAAADDNLLNGQGGLSESDLVGSLMFLFLAGYDTTAATLSFVMALLATHPEEQEKLYKELRNVIEDRTIPEYGDCLKLKFCLAIIYEASRLYAIASFVPKIASESCVLRTRSRDGSPVEIPVEQGTVLLLSIDAIHMNPRYWPDPYEFKPARFLEGDKIYNNGAFMSFSAGLRACIGRRFAEIELITAVASIILRYKVTVLKEAQFAHETAEETKARVLQARKGLNLQPARLPLCFTRRD